MGVTRIKLTNFKSFHQLDITLGKFDLLIGPNASGKSNFVQILKFLRDINHHGLDNAISLQGGIEYLRNIRIGASESLALEIDLARPFRFAFSKDVGVETLTTNYKFSLSFRKQRQDFQVSEDTFTHNCKFFRISTHDKKPSWQDLGDGRIQILNIGGKVKVELSGPPGVTLPKDILPPFWQAEVLQPRNLLHLLLESSDLLIPSWENVLRNTAIYDFDPRLPKKAVTITGKSELEEDGNNLTLVLKNIIQDKESDRKLSNLIRDLLPFVDDIAVEKFADKSMLFKLRERYFKRRFLPASLISDGTINLAALIIALYFEQKLLTIIEEPERSIHPYLISKVVQMMKEASESKQVFATTHNPEMVKYTPLESLLLISRDQEGFSTVVRPVEKEEIKAFLKSEIGIEELYVQNLL